MWPLQSHGERHWWWFGSTIHHSTSGHSVKSWKIARAELELWEFVLVRERGWCGRGWGRQAGCGEGKQKISEKEAVLATVVWTRWQSLLNIMDQQSIWNEWRLYTGDNCREDTVFCLCIANTGSKGAFSHINGNRSLGNSFWKSGAKWTPNAHSKCYDKGKINVRWSVHNNNKTNFIEQTELFSV